MASKKPPYTSSTPPPQPSVSEKLEWAEIKSSIHALREDVKMSIENSNQQFNSLRQNLDQNLNEIKDIKQILEKNDQRLQNLEDKTQSCVVKMEELSMEEKKLERISIILESDRAEFYLRLQNISEEKGENLKEILADILAQTMEEDKEKILMDIDEVYRVSTRYAMRHNLPREVHVRFTKKTRRSQILQRMRVATFKYKEKEITILKQVPRKVRDLRKDYQFLTRKLHQRGINFRWLIPEGIFLLWKGQRYRLDSVEKAELFYRQKFEQTEEPLKETQLVVRPRESKQISELSEEYLMDVAMGGEVAPSQLQEPEMTAEYLLSSEVKEQRERVMTRAAKEKQKPPT